MVSGHLARLCPGRRTSPVSLEPCLQCLQGPWPSVLPMCLLGNPHSASPSPHTLSLYVSGSPAPRLAPSGFQPGCRAGPHFHLWRCRAPQPVTGLLYAQLAPASAGARRALAASLAREHGLSPAARSPDSRPCLATCPCSVCRLRLWPESASSSKADMLPSSGQHPSPCTVCTQVSSHVGCLDPEVLFRHIALPPATHKYTTHWVIHARGSLVPPVQRDLLAPIPPWRLTHFPSVPGASGLVSGDSPLNIFPGFLPMLSHTI